MTSRKSENKEPRFTPRPGQIDYTNARRAPVINCVVEFKGAILLTRRSFSPHPKIPSSRVARDFLLPARRDEEAVVYPLRRSRNTAGRENLRNPLGYGQSCAITASFRTSEYPEDTPSSLLLVPREDWPVSRPKVFWDGGLMNFYPGLWSGISGFLDDEKNIEEKAKEELWEEVGIGERAITEIVEGAVFETEDAAHGKTWIVHPVLVRVSTNAISPNWEIEECRWINPEELSAFEVVPGFERVVRAFF